MRRIFTIFLFVLIAAASVKAEYRVFVLRIRKLPPKAEVRAPDSEAASEQPPPEERFVMSNLDPDQYRGYYPVKADEEVKYIKTWRCPGRTSDFAKFCPDPHPPPAE